MPVLALDAGGTTTRALVVDHIGRCLALARAGSGNPISSGPEAAAASLTSSGLAALSSAQLEARDLELVLVAAAGAGTGTHRDELVSRLAEAGLAGRVVFASDLLASFCSGTHEEAGYALVAGTGAAAIRVEEGRQVGTGDGLGWLLGDEGSGFWIGRRVALAALADLDGRGPATTLTAALRARLDVPADLAPRLAAESMSRLLYAARPVRLADLAGLAFVAADDGDGVAHAILTEAAQRLATTLRAVTTPRLQGPVVLGGGALAHSRTLREAALSAYAGEGAVPETVVVRDGAVGAAVLALRHAGVVVDEPLFATLTASVADHG